MTMRLLVTGFGPFPSMPRNPSAALARAVAGSPRWRRLGITAESRILTTAYAALRTDLDPALARRPDAVLMIGVAGRSRLVRVERRATGRRSTLFPDVSGETAGEVPHPREPRERHTTLQPIRALLALRRHRVPARISRDAGRYLCNAAYFRALAGEAPALFVHIPKPQAPRPAHARRRRRLDPGASLAAALVEIGLALLVLSRQRVAAAAARR